MVQINNAEMKKAFSDSTKTQLLDQPNQVDNTKVIPIVDITPRNHKFSKTFPLTGSLSNATSLTTYTASTKNDTFITAICFSVAADTTATATEFSVKCVDAIDNTTRSILTMRRITLTAFNQTITQAIVPPLKIARGSIVTLTSDSNVANFVGSARMEGFEEESM